MNKIDVFEDSSHGSGRHPHHLPAPRFGHTGAYAYGLLALHDTEVITL
jgi:hypothetical protein